MSLSIDEDLKHENITIDRGAYTKKVQKEAMDRSGANGRSDVIEAMTNRFNGVDAVTDLFKWSRSSFDLRLCQGHTFLCKQCG